MPPIHLIHWGPPTEHDEISDIEQCFQAMDAKISVKKWRMTDPDHGPLRAALKAALEDVESSVVYFSCHGCAEGFLFSEQVPVLLSYNEFSNWLREMVPQDDLDYVLPPERSLVLGSCLAMSSGVAIESYLPGWITKVAGFKNRPTDRNVVELAAGVIYNLWYRGNCISSAMIDAFNSAGGKGADPFVAAESARTKAIAGSKDEPLQFVADYLRPLAIIATREWIRIPP